MQSRLTGDNAKVSKDLAQSILTHGIENFVLLIVQERYSSQLSKQILRPIEQFWMLLRPTFNRSLFVDTNNGAPMNELVRRQMSTLIYIYELVGNTFSPIYSIVYGLKQLVRTGITCLDGSVLSIQYNVANGSLISGLL